MRNALREKRRRDVEERAKLKGVAYFNAPRQFATDLEKIFMFP
jgi:hypothetical protein